MAACYYPRGGSKILDGSAGVEGGSACPYLAYDPLRQHHANQHQHQPLKGHELLLFYCVILVVFLVLRGIDTFLLAGANNANRSTLAGEEASQEEDEGIDDGNTSKRVPALLRPQ